MLIQLTVKVSFDSFSFTLTANAFLPKFFCLVDVMYFSQIFTKYFSVPKQSSPYAGVYVKKSNKPTPNYEHALLKDGAILTY